MAGALRYFTPSAGYRAFRTEVNLAHAQPQGGGSAPLAATNRSRADDCRVFVLPLRDVARIEHSRVLVILHAYHLDVAERMIRRLASLNASGPVIPMRLVVTTDSESKAQKLERMFARRSTDVQMDHLIEIHPNRGRNVAPFLAACRTHAQEDDMILHLHTKKSPHAPQLAGWGEYMFDCLAGSREVTESAMAILNDAKTGLLYPGYYRSIADSVVWGPNFVATQCILKAMNVHITHATSLEFPAGMMFWTRLAALKPLLDLNLSYTNFEVEAGQTDGTLAHAIERAMIYIVEHGNFLVQPVVWIERIDDCRASALVRN